MKIFTAALILSLICTSINGQSFKIKDLSASEGNWKGKLTYLDYTSGKPYSMSVNIKINITENKRGYIMAYEYPAEPHANSMDTTYINGKQFGKYKIVEFKKTAEGDFTLITEIAGEDGNDHKKATLRHTYKLINDSFSVIKDVKFEGTEIWIKRNEYLLNKAEK